jgi:predicted DCC family thiol-disulfide oxidoreductase YuxK
VRGHHVILYDGVCGLCNRLNRFVLARDARGAFRFASLQSRFARDFLTGHNLDPSDLDTLYLIAHYGTERQAIHTKSRATLLILKEFGGPWRVAGILGVLPTVLLDCVYDLVARVRYRIFGRYDACPMPRPEWRDRFIDV